MMKSRVIDYAGVLSKLKTRLRAIDKERDELFKAIQSMSNLAAIDSPDASHFKDSTIVITADNISRLSVYDATIALLEAKGSSMHTNDIIPILKEKGVVPKDRPTANIVTVMYKAARKRNDSKLIVNKGEWSLKGWK